MSEVTVIEPQEGYQMRALSSPADIVIGGGAAGSGKTYCLLLDPLRDISNPKFGGVIFRRTMPQIKNEGGLWDTSKNIYTHVGARSREQQAEWIFPSGAKIKFSHLEHEKNIFDWQGSQIPFIGFDELTHFSEKMFFYLLTRNRSTSGVKPYVRATCNPDPDSWVAKLIAWWINEETGYPIPERDGVIRYFIRYGEEYIWGDTREEVVELARPYLERMIDGSGVDPSEFVKSITFIHGSVYENKELLSVDPAYLGNLISQDEQTRMQLLEGNWKVRISDIDIYDYYAFQGMFDNVREVDRSGKFITADIAMKGSNMFIVGGWEGDCLVDIDIIPKSNGKEVIEAITKMASNLGVPNNKIAFDADGVGAFVDGFISGAIPFNGGLPPKEVTDPVSKKKIKENYKNWKAQCFYRSGSRVSAGDIKISEYVANKMYNSSMTVRQRFMYERRAIKRGKPDSDGKLSLIPKEEMKPLIGGDSPDLMDMLAMKEIFNLLSKTKWYVAA